MYLKYNILAANNPSFFSYLFDPIMSYVIIKVMNVSITIYKKFFKIINYFEIIKGEPCMSCSMFNCFINYYLSVCFLLLRRGVLEVHRSGGIGSIGAIKWSLAMCLFMVFLMVYFSLWKGVKSTGKVMAKSKVKTYY